MHGNEGLGKIIFFWEKHSVQSGLGESRVVNAAIESRCCLDVKKNWRDMDQLDHFGVGATDAYASRNCLDLQDMKSARN